MSSMTQDFEDDINFGPSVDNDNGEQQEETLQIRPNEETLQLRPDEQTKEKTKRNYKNTKIPTKRKTGLVNRTRNSKSSASHLAKRKAVATKTDTIGSYKSGDKKDREDSGTSGDSSFKHTSKRKKTTSLISIKRKQGKVVDQARNASDMTYTNDQYKAEIEKRIKSLPYHDGRFKKRDRKVIIKYDIPGSKSAFWNFKGAQVPAFKFQGEECDLCHRPLEQAPNNIRRLRTGRPFPLDVESDQRFPSPERTENKNEVLRNVVETEIKHIKGTNRTARWGSCEHKFHKE